ALNADKAKSTESVIACLDPKLVPEPDDRLAILAGIAAFQPSNPDLSKRLALTSMGDPSEPVRSQTVSLIKSRNDEWAMHTLVNAYMNSFESEGGRVKDPVVKAAAGAALQGLDD